MLKRIRSIFLDQEFLRSRIPEKKYLFLAKRILYPSEVTVRVRRRPSDRLSRGAAGIQAEDVYVATTRAGRKSDPRYPDLADTTTSSENRTDSREGPKTLPKTSYVATVRAREDCCRFMRALFRGPSTGVKTLSPRPCNHRLQI